MKRSLPTRPPVQFARKLTGTHMEFIFVSPLGSKVECNLRCTTEQYMRWYEGKEHVQNIFPLLDAETRELFISGMGPGEWNRVTSEY